MSRNPQPLHDCYTTSEFGAGACIGAFDEKLQELVMNRQWTYSVCIGATVFLIALSGTEGGQLWHDGEVNAPLRNIEAGFSNGKIVARCGSGGELAELSLTWGGRTISVPEAEIKDISLADLQSIRVTIPASISTDSGNKMSNPHLFLTMAYGPKLVNKSLQWVRRHVRFEFYDGDYKWRFVAIPETSKPEWTIYFKNVGKPEEEYDKHEGAIQPWSLGRAYGDDVPASLDNGAPDGPLPIPKTDDSHPANPTKGSPAQDEKPNDRRPSDP